MTLLARTRLLQMASQAFPIGGYSHSHGLESAIAAGLVTDETSVERWIGDLLTYSMGTFELPLLRRLSDAWAADRDTVSLLNDDYLASRETAELRRASVQMGFSLRALLDVLPDLPDWFRQRMAALSEPSLPCLWSGLATVWEISSLDSMLAYAWVWAENQVLVAMKSVPIGQSSGQRVLLNIGNRIAQQAHVWSQADLPLCNFAPGFAILSCQHETQYSRLFRS